MLENEIEIMRAVLHADLLVCVLSGVAGGEVGLLLEIFLCTIFRELDTFARSVVDTAIEILMAAAGGIEVTYVQRIPLIFTDADRLPLIHPVGWSNIAASTIFDGDYSGTNLVGPTNDPTRTKGGPFTVVNKGHVSIIGILDHREAHKRLGGIHRIRIGFVINVIPLNEQIGLGDITNLEHVIGTLVRALSDSDGIILVAILLAHCNVRQYFVNFILAFHRTLCINPMTISLTHEKLKIQNETKNSYCTQKYRFM